MTETLPVEPVERGTLTVSDRVIDKLAERAATLVDGVVRAGSSIERLSGRRLPRATSQVSGHKARVGLQIAVAWPYPLAETAAGVRKTVEQELTRMSGLDVVAVDVTVDRVELDVTPSRRRVE